MKSKHQNSLDLGHKMLFALVLSLAISSIIFFQSDTQTGAATGTGSGEIEIQNAIPIILSANATTTTPRRNGTIDNVTTQIIAQDSIKEIVVWKRNNSEIVDLYMPFEKTNSTNTNNTRDYSSNTYWGVEKGTILWNATGGFDGNGSYIFDGNDSYIEIENPSTILSQSQGTWALWFNSEQYSESQGQVLIAAHTLGSTSHIQRLDLNETNIFMLNKAISDNYRLTVEVPNLIGEWHHVAVTSGPQGNRIYVDGEEKTPDYLSGSNASTHWLDDLSENTLQIGSHNIGGGQSADFNGTMDEVQMYNVQLSSEQVLALYENRTIIAANQTYVDDVWSFDVTPNDGNVDGVTVSSNSVTILEHIPTVSSVVLNTTNPLTNASSENITSSISATDPTNDELRLIYDWRLNETNFTVANIPFEKNNLTSYNNSRDYSNNELHGEVFADTFWNGTGGFDGKGAYEFDGDGDHISLPGEMINRASNIGTLMLWVKTNQPTQNQTIFWTAENRDRALSINDSGNFYMTFYDGNFGYRHLPGGTSDTNWHHLAMTWNIDQGELAFYVDGELGSSYSGASWPDTAAAANRTCLGGTAANGGCDTLGSILTTSWFNGTIDEFKVFSQVLTQDQVQAIYNNRTDLIVSQQTGGADNWSLCVTANDGDEDSPTVCSSSLEVNYPPESPVIVNPTNASSQTNRSVDFTWNNSVDLNTDDTLTYHFQFFNNSDLTAEYVNITGVPTDNINDSNYTYFPDLNVDQSYYWRVKANDSKETSSWTDLYEFSVLSSNVISLPTSSVSFGEINSSFDKNTTAGSGYQPLIISNDGNIPLNISLNSSQMFTSANSLWQFQVEENETDAYISANESWTNFTINLNATMHIFNLWHENDSNTANRANLHSLVYAAADESAGSKTATIYIESTLSE